MLKFKISEIVCDYTKYRMSFLDKEVWNYLPDIRKLEIDDIDETKFYKMIGLTKDEMKLFDKSNVNDVVKTKTQKPKILIDSSDDSEEDIPTKKKVVKKIKSKKEKNDEL
uniref:Uncharacterized protein n=1 Tax=viral metagenome TaxID=1070528 RepID=A0A6C0EEN6_9ZZZZ